MSGPSVYQDGEGWLWLPVVTPEGEAELFCYNSQAQRVVGSKWPSYSLADAEAVHGPLALLGPVGEEDGYMLRLQKKDGTWASWWSAPVPEREIEEAGGFAAYLEKFRESEPLSGLLGRARFERVRLTVAFEEPE